MPRTALNFKLRLVGVVADLRAKSGQYLLGARGQTPVGCPKYEARCLLRQKLAKLIQKVVVDLVVTDSEELRPSRTTWLQPPSS
jgi:hypothetical protein